MRNTITQSYRILFNSVPVHRTNCTFYTKQRSKSGRDGAIATISIITSYLFSLSSNCQCHLCSVIIFIMAYET